MTRRLAGWAVLAGAMLAGCTAAPRVASPTLGTGTTPFDTPPLWHATRPADPAQLGDLARWWEQFDDPVLSRLLDAAQAASPSIAAAHSRIEQARAAWVGAEAALGPTLDASASASRGRQDLLQPLGTLASIGLQAAWEIDLFGANRAARSAATARLDAAAGAWHDARVSVAAELAASYNALRACEAQWAQARLDAASRAQTARLTELAAEAGFQAPASAALARASAAQANAALTQRRAACELGVKALAAQTGIDEPGLRSALAPGTAQLPQPQGIGVAAVPAQVLAQRPDLYAAGHELLAASADIGQAEARRYPRIALAGSLGAGRVSAAAASLDGAVWSIGPVSVTLPIFDGGVRRANVDAARARYDEAAATYAAKLRGAVREVEEALVTLQSTADRGGDAEVAAQGFAASLRATEARYNGGLATLFELEDARRSAVQAQMALIDLRRERVQAWITLYRALGGGWSAPEAASLACAGTPATPTCPTP